MSRTVMLPRVDTIPVNIAHVKRQMLRHLKVSIARN